MVDLTGKRIAFLATNGYEDSELTSPWRAVTDAGGHAVLVSPESGAITGEKGHEQPVDQALDTADAADFDALVLPGGVQNADDLRVVEPAVAFARAFFDAHKPVGAICHAAWLLVEAGVVSGRTVTSWPSLKTDLRNAGAAWVDEQVVVDDGLVTSRNPGDLDAFGARIVEEFADGARAGDRA